MFIRLLSIMLPVWPVMLLAACFGWLTIASNIGLIATSAFLIASAALHPSVAELSVAIVGVRFFGVARAVFRYLERYISHDATFRLLSSVRVWFYNRLEPLAPARLAQWQSGELFGAIVGDVETLKDFYLRVLAPPVIALLVLAAMAVFLARFVPVLMYILAAVFLLVGVFLPVLVRTMNQGNAQQLVEARAQLKAYLVDSIAGMTELAAFDRSEQQMHTIAALNDRLIQLQGRVAASSGLTEALGSFVMNATVWAVLWLTIPLVQAGKLDGVYLAVLTLAVQSSFEAVLPLPMAVHYLAESMAAARRLFGIVDTGVGAVQPGQVTVLPDRPDIIVEDLSFNYGTGCVLNNISFALPAGRRIAIVGSSGAGKSTLIHLLLRFWNYEQGSIKIGGREYTGFSPEQVRTLFSVVAQQTHIFNTTIRDNILLAKPNASAEEVEQALRGAALSEFINSLPQGLDTMVGQNGKGLSGGQRQRIAIARAILKNAPVVLLDEPTVGLDAATEQQVMTAIESLMSGRTTILITHHLTGLESMDEILVLEEGTIAERGTLTELLAKRGLFYQMWRLQHDYCFNF